MKRTTTGRMLVRVLATGVASCFLIPAIGPSARADDGALSGHRHRVVVSTDIGGTDPDDVQSMVHLLAYADSFDLEGLVSSPYGLGRKEHILNVIDAYASDYSNLKSHSDKFPTPGSLRAICKQGTLENPGQAGVGEPTEGSEWIIECARRDGPRPLHVLVWGGIEDLAQALHDAPDILPKLRVYWIGGPNKKWSVDAYNYVEQNHPKLWMIEANATYRGWFVGGNQEGGWGNKAFVSKHIAGHGALGETFVRAKADIKMGDTPSVSRLMRGVSEDPSQPGWGGKYVRIWDGRKTVFNRHTTKDDRVEVFGVTEFVLPVPEGFSSKNTASMIFSGGRPASEGVIEGDFMRFRFSPRDAKKWSYVIKSDFLGLDGQLGEFDAVPPPLERTSKPSTTHPNWWIDDPDPAAAEGVHPGAKSVNQWREDFLRDFGERMDWCESPRRQEATAKPTPPKRWGNGYLEHPPEWYRSPEALAIADSVIQYQSPLGGWPKSTNLAQSPRSASDVPLSGSGRANSIDNNATTLPMQFLALIAHATGEAKYKDSFTRGLDYLFTAQYPNGGWPQFYPLREGYYSHITYNDGAMMHVMTMLRDVAKSKPPYAFVDQERRAKAATAVAKGIDCILRTQIKQNGERTVWCAQHDEITLEPAWARNYEIPSLSGSESVGIARFLMGEEDPSPEIIAAIEGAVTWFGTVQINGLVYHRGRAPDGERDGWVKPDLNSGPLWARFYEIGSNRPIFTGRDKVIRYSLDQIERERRGGYSYYGNWAASLLEKSYPRWQAKHKTTTSP